MYVYVYVCVYVCVYIYMYVYVNVYVYVYVNVLICNLGIPIIIIVPESILGKFGDRTRLRKRIHWLLDGASTRDD